MPETARRRAAPSGPPRPVMIVGLLLLAQAAAFFGLAAFFLVPLASTWMLVLEALPSALRGLAFAMLGIVALWSAVGFFRLWRRAWLGAVFLQGTGLLLALSLYFQEKPWYAYLIMLYGIVLVIYLNYSEVQAAFRPKTPIMDPRDA